MSKHPSDTAERFQIRLPDGLRDQIKADAAANGRSMNAEIITRLEGGAETLRDKFAALALAGLSTATDADGQWQTDPAGLARESYAIADAMLAARSGESA